MIDTNAASVMTGLLWPSLGDDEKHGALNAPQVPSLPRRCRASLTRWASAASASGYSLIGGGATAPASSSATIRSRCARSRDTAGRSTCHVGTRGFEPSRCRCDPNQPPTRLQHAVRPHLHIVANRVEHHVATGNRFGEVLAAIIDHPIGTEAAHIIGIGRAGSGDHRRAEVFCQLDRETGNPSGAALDQDGFVRAAAARCPRQPRSR